MTTSAAATSGHGSTLAITLLNEITEMKNAHPDIAYRDLLASKAMDALAADIGETQSADELRRTARAISGCKWIPADTRGHLVSLMNRAADGLAPFCLLSIAVQAARQRVGMESVLTCLRVIGEDGMRAAAEAICAQLDNSFGSKFAGH